MAEQDENASSIIKNGNSFLTRFLLTFIVISFFILPPPPDAQRRINQNVGDGQNLIDMEREDIKRRLTTVNRELQKVDQRLFNLQRSLTPKSEKLRDKQESELMTKRDKILDDRRERRDKLIKLNEDFITLEKARTIRQVALPGTSFSLMETDVRMLYPGAIAVAMLMLLNYRRRLLKSLMSERSSAKLPVWAAPIPLRSFGQSFWSTLYLNVVGLSLILALLSLYLDFVLRDEFYPALRIAVVQLVLGCAVIVVYSFAAFRAIVRSLTKNEEVEPSK